MSLKKMPGRMILRHRDIMNIFGCTYRTASRIIQKVRLAFNKSKDQPITYVELCAVYGLKEERVKEYIIG